MVLAHPATIACVLAEGKIGFVGPPEREVSQLRAGDTLFRYATEGTLGPEGMLFAELRASGESYKVGTRDAELEIDLTVVALAERGTGVPIASLVPELRLLLRISSRARGARFCTGRLSRSTPRTSTSFAERSSPSWAYLAASGSLPTQPTD